MITFTYENDFPGYKKTSIHTTLDDEGLTAKELLAQFIIFLQGAGWTADAIKRVAQNIAKECADEDEYNVFDWAADIEAGL